MRIRTTQIFAIIYATVLLLSIGNANAALVESTFDSDEDGWLVSGDATSVVPSYVAIDGNPGGHIKADDTASGGIWYFQAPGKFLGDISGAFGQLLRFDLKQSGGGGQISRDDLILNGAGFELTLEFDSNPLPVDEWVSYAISLDDNAPWMNGGGLASNADILAVLSSLDRMRIRGEYINGADTGRLDNVSVNVVPIPAAVYMLGSGLLGIVGLKKRSVRAKV